MASAKKVRPKTNSKTRIKSDSIRPSAGNDKEVRDYLKKVLTWGEAHIDWKDALEGLDAAQRGIRPTGCPHSPWELLEHARIAQWDIVQFCIDAKHKSPDWPSGYWPKNPAPPNDKAWEKSVQDFERDTWEMAKLIEDPSRDLYAKIPHGTGQTLLRQALLLADHNAYHLGQLVLVRRLLGAWNKN
jgi:hypothetical protein